MSAMDDTTTKFIDDWQKRRGAEAERRRTEWRADHTDIPDLDFAPPDCPICDRMTDYEDGYFICEGCDVAWPDNGYGSQACHANGSRFAAPEPTP